MTNKVNNIYSVSLEQDSLTRHMASRPIQALSELIWNSLDAESTIIKVNIVPPDMNTNSGEIYIQDNGSGIHYDIAATYFSKFGGSWKKEVTHTKCNRVLHGEKGEGRLKAFSLGENIEWNTIYECPSEKSCFTYKISSSAKKINQFSLTEKVKTNEHTGTSVNIYNLKSNLFTKNHLGDINNVCQEITAIFAPYLLTYNNVSIFINNNEITPASLLKNDPKEFIITHDNNEGLMKIFLWQTIKSNDLFLCKKNQSTLDLYTGREYSKIKPLGYKYTIYLSSSLFSDESISIIDLNENASNLIAAAITKANNYFKSLKKAENKKIKELWIKEGIYPYENDNSNPLESAKRDVFDICAGQIQSKLTKFTKADTETRKFTFKLLAQALEDNPKTIQRVMSEVLKLDKNELEMFADLLSKMDLPNIIKSAKEVSDRLVFLDGLEHLVFDNKTDLRERDELHPILENEVWLFDENFTLATTEKNLVNALKQHLKILGKKYDDVTAKDITGNYKDRIDLMLHRSLQIRTDGSKDFLVIELKRPSQKIDEEVLSQIKKYARAVANSDRFDTKKSKWKFIAISNEISETAKGDIDPNNHRCNWNSQAYGLNIEIYALTWRQVIDDARARLEFIKNELGYKTNEQHIHEYLIKNYSEVLPDSFSAEYTLN